jgi:hypothetical protein
MLSQLQDYADASLAWVQQGESQLAEVLHALKESQQLEEAQRSCQIRHSFNGHLPTSILLTDENSDVMEQIYNISDDSQLAEELWRA